MTVFLVEAVALDGRVIETVRVEARTLAIALDEVAADYVGFVNVVRGWPESDPSAVKVWERRSA